MFIVDSLLIGGLRFVLANIVAAADAELQDDTALREQLLEAEMRREVGEIDEAQYAAIEREVVARLHEIKGRQPGALTMSADYRVAGVEIETFDTGGGDGGHGGHGLTQRNGVTETNRGRKQ
jgi:hypothetical protein